MGRAELVSSLRRDLRHALIAVDFDGTLAPIVPDPDDARIVPGGLEVLTRLAEQGAQVAVITGRAAETVLRLGQLTTVPGLMVAGQYGIESWRAGTLLRPHLPPAIERLRGELPAVIAQHSADPGVWIEDKGLSLVVHTRRAADPSGSLAALRPGLEALARKFGVEAHPGRDVMELRVAGYDKGRALRELITEVRPSALLFAGDDRGDLWAFAAVEAARRADGVQAWAVGVVSDEVPDIAAAVDVCVGSPAELVALLTELVP